MIAYYLLYLQIADVDHVPAELVGMTNNPLLFKVAVDASLDKVAEKVYVVKQMTSDIKSVQEFADLYKIRAPHV